MKQVQSSHGKTRKGDTELDASEKQFAIESKDAGTTKAQAQGDNSASSMKMGSDSDIQEDKSSRIPPKLPTMHQHFEREALESMEQKHSEESNVASRLYTSSSVPVLAHGIIHNNDSLKIDSGDAPAKSKTETSEKKVLELNNQQELDKLALQKARRLAMNRSTARQRRKRKSDQMDTLQETADLIIAHNELIRQQNTDLQVWISILKSLLLNDSLKRCRKSINDTTDTADPVPPEEITSLLEKMESLVNSEIPGGRGGTLEGIDASSNLNDQKPSTNTRLADSSRATIARSNLKDLGSRSSTNGVTPTSGSMLLLTNRVGSDNRHQKYYQIPTSTIVHPSVINTGNHVRHPQEEKSKTAISTPAFQHQDSPPAIQQDQAQPRLGQEKMESKLLYSAAPTLLPSGPPSVNEPFIQSQEQRQTILPSPSLSPAVSQLESLQEQQSKVFQLFLLSFSSMHHSPAQQQDQINILQEFLENQRQLIQYIQQNNYMDSLQHSRTSTESDGRSVYDRHHQEVPLQSSLQPINPSVLVTQPTRNNNPTLPSPEVQEQLRKEVSVILYLLLLLRQQQQLQSSTLSTTFQPSGQDTPQFSEGTANENTLRSQGADNEDSDFED